MKFSQSFLSGVYLVQLTPIEDERGFFARSFCKKEFATHGLETFPVQCNISFNKERGTLRGMHFQTPPHAEAKLVRCTAGIIYDIVIDLRTSSPTFTQWATFELSSKNHTALYIPEGFAHGFQTLTDNSEVFYQMFNFYEPASAGGIRFNDPAFNIEWPLENPIISQKDKSYRDYDGFAL